MQANDFRRDLLRHFTDFGQTLTTGTGDWVIKGFIDIYRNIYTISIDTKVISKIVELMLFPAISQFAEEKGYRMVLSEHQNHYPDITFIGPDNTKIALDLKSTYRTGAQSVNGFTLGSFTGYFRQRTSAKNITFPYSHYAAHFVLGVVYSRTDALINERTVFTLDELQDIISVVKDFTFLLQEKWRIASERPGSGNTKNIGSINDLQALVEGQGPFAEYGELVFDDYWMNYLTKDMARAIDSNVPYRTLEQYWIWRERISRKQGNRPN